MAVIGQSHLLWRSRVPDHIYHGNTIVRIVPIEVGPCQLSKSKILPYTLFSYTFTKQCKLS